MMNKEQMFDLIGNLPGSYLDLSHQLLINDITEVYSRNITLGNTESEKEAGYNYYSLITQFSSLYIGTERENARYYIRCISYSP